MKSNQYVRIYLLISIFFLFTSSIAQVSEPAREKGELLVMLKHDADPIINLQLKAELEARGVTINKKITRTMNVWLLVFEETPDNPQKILNQIRKHPAVEIAQFNHKVYNREVIPNDPSFNVQWALKNTGQSNGLAGADIKATEAWEITTNGVTALGDSIVIAMVDGGVDLNHTDLNLWKNYGEIPNNLIDDDNNGYIDDYDGWNAYSNSGNMQISDHGTHVAGIAAAKTNNITGIAGVSYNAKVLPIAGSGTNEMLVVSSYDYVYTMRKLYNESQGTLGAFIVVSNSSFGIDGGNPANYPLWSAMYDSLGMVGVLNVASTANRGWDIDIEGDVPTAMTNESLLTVTNTTNLDLLSNQAAWGFNHIDIAAPGTTIYSTRQGNAYGYKTGTSMSSPMVSGSVALMYAAADTTSLLTFRQFPALAVSKIKRMLIATVDTLPSLIGKTVSGGRLNLFKAVTMSSNPPVLMANPPSVTFAMKPFSMDTIAIQISSTSSVPNSFIVSLPPDTNWITTEVTSGILMPGEEYTLNIIFNSFELTEGSYQVSVSVNDYFLNQLVIPIELKVDRNIATRSYDYISNISLSPNPFSDKLYLKLNLVKNSPVKIKAFNIQGIEIADIAELPLPSGEHIFEWNGLNSQRQNVSPGVYFLTVTDNSGTYTLKAIKGSR